MLEGPITGLDEIKPSSAQLKQTLMLKGKFTQNDHSANIYVPLFHFKHV